MIEISTENSRLETRQNELNDTAWSEGQAEGETLEVEGIKGSNKGDGLQSWMGQGDWIRKFEFLGKTMDLFAGVQQRI